MRLHYTILFFLVLFLSMTALAQQVKVSGIVKRVNSGEPLAGVTISSGSSRTQTDNDGNFSLSVSSARATLSFSHVGFETKQVALNGETKVEVSMTQKTGNLDDVIIVGYGSVRKKDLVGAVSSVSAKDMEGQAMNSIEQGLQGRTAGVQITQSDAAPDGGMSVIIRGSNSAVGGTEPLYVIDGVPVSGGNIRVKGPQDNFGPTGDLQEMSQAPNMLSFLNPADIESIQILKDASSTAIYGSRGSNGVVLITTKKGSRTRTRVSLRSGVDVSNVFRKMDLLTGPEYAEAQNLRYIINAYYAGGQVYENIIKNLPYPGNYATNGTYRPSPADYANGNADWTDWQDVVLRTGISSRNTLGVSGGSDKTRYYLSLSNDDINGTIVGSKFKRNTVNFNLEANLSKNITLSNSVITSLTKSNRAQASIVHGGEHRGIITAVQRYNPLSLVGSVFFNEDNGTLTGSDDPYTLATKFDDVQTNVNILNNMSLKWKLTQDFTLQVNGGVRYTNDSRDMYYPMSTLRGQNMGGGAAFNGKNETVYLLNENTLNYQKSIGLHSLNLMAGFTQENTVYRTSSNTVSGFLNDITGYYNLGASSNFSQPQSDYVKYSLLSGIARINYSFDERYLFTASLRADGSSKFGENNKWGYFPSVGAAWRISEEKFAAGLGSVSDLKLRVSYGETGNQGISPYQSMVRLSPANYPFNGTLYTGLQNANLGNADLRWEKTAQYNLGIDLGFWNQRLTVTANAYVKKTTDLLQNVLLSPNSGYSQQVINLGALENKGVELEISGLIVDKKDWRWRMSGNISTNKIKVTDLGGLNEYPGGYTLWWDWRPYKIRVGEPLGILYGYKVEKIMKTQEDIQQAAKDNPRKALGEYDYVKDKTGNMALMKIGNTNPDFTFGISSEVSYKQWSFSFLIAGSIGQDIFNLNKRLWQQDAQTVAKYYTEGWIPEVRNSQGEVVIADNGGTLPVYRSINGRSLNVPYDEMIEDGSWIKLRNVTLSYSFSSGIKWLTELKPFVSGSNLFCIDKYSGLDPEASVYGQDPTRRGTAYGEYPMARTFSFGLNATF
jgi:TonB-linked SusC/RagA family outer membrane protein